MKNKKINDEDFAVIGIGIQFPNARNKDEFWENIKTGRNCIDQIPKERWDYSDYVDDAEADKYSQYGSFIKDLNMFNPLLFNVSPRDAELMDPQLRKLMEVTINAIDDAGYTKEKMHDTGVFIGNIHCEYSKKANDPVIAGLIEITSQYELANKISNVFDFIGPSLVVNTACTSSLSAIHLAMNSLKNDECKYAVVGGSNLQLSPERFMGLKEIGIIGNRKFCSPFGKENGFVLGEGIGVVILKKLEDAKNDKDNIYCIIRSSNSKHIGGKVSFGDIDKDNLKSITKDTFTKSGISPKTIGLIESGANGVSALDAAEFNCLNEVFKEAKVADGSVAISSVKSNYGNIEAASGIAQLVKVIMQLKENVLVPSINVDSIESDIEQCGALRIQTEIADWKKSKNPRRALISNVGAGGNVVQIICEEYNEEETNSTESNRFVYLISAPEKISLKNTVERLLEYISEKSFEPQDIAYTLQVGRENYRHRLAFTASDQDEIIKKLRLFLEEKMDSIYVGSLKASSKEINIDTEECIESVKSDAHDELAEKWVNGYLIDWESLHPFLGGKRIHIPGICIKKKKYWLEQNEKIDSEEANSLEELIAKIFGELFKMNAREIEYDEKLRKYGLDSLNSMRAINKINELLNIEVLPSQIMNLETVNDIVAFLKKEYDVSLKDIKDSSDEKTADENNISLDVREAITDILLKKVISGDISAEKVSEIDELLFS